MTNVRCQALLLIALLSSLAPRFVTAQRAANLRGGEDKAQAIRAALDQLVSPNPSPKVIPSGDEAYELPEGFDVAKQHDVDAAVFSLRNSGPAAFPDLIERWGDVRYCTTRASALSGSCHNASVGDVCRAIIYDQLQPYGGFQEAPGRRSLPRRPEYVRTFLQTQDQAAAWCNTHGKKSPFEMQLLVLDWVIAEENKRPADFADTEREFLHKFRAELVASGKAVGNGNYYDLARDFRIESRRDLGDPFAPAPKPKFNPQPKAAKE